MDESCRDVDETQARNIYGTIVGNHSTTSRKIEKILARSQREKTVTDARNEKDTYSSQRLIFAYRSCSDAEIPDTNTDR